MQFSYLGYNIEFVSIYKIGHYRICSYWSIVFMASIFTTTRQNSGWSFLIYQPSFKILAGGSEGAIAHPVSWIFL
ncbi:hypothetical protein [Dyadobacter sp. 3J3]|uniref:hypothetical protein n=1 Tax=Dyadobacter sp. 3J3 TaxID=2606600 RepID=UPI00135BED2D|nr:hypothetical protein [Dyadobacter sp. 3J3]